MKQLVLIGGGLAIGYLVIQGLQKVDSINKLATDLDISAQIRRFVPSLMGGYIDVEVVVRNPISAGVRIKTPSIRLMYSSTLVGQSDPQNTTIDIAANAVSRFALRIEYQSVGVAGPMYRMVMDALQRKPVTLDAKVFTGLVVAGTTTEMTKDISLRLINA